ncbi:MAG: Gfo/Idh/MocA family oxidoreductase, partial [Mameliella sp.]|nr:Gfo/Idh/MocA family oxidoreductase [Phaeodactylibacter sp.]
MQRRSFIKKASAGAAALSIGGLNATAQSYNRIMGANDRVHVAIIGCQRRYGGLLNSLSTAKNTAVTYVCDVDSRRQDKAINRVTKVMGSAPKGEKDMRKIMDQKDVDATIHSTPDHWHAPGAILSMQAGKHAYVEKPCSHNPAEGELLIAWQKKTGLQVQMGAQQRSSMESKEVVKAIHEGLIGEAYLATAFYSNNRARVPDAKKIPVPDYLDWDLFQGPAPRTEFFDIVGDYNWHWFWRWGTAETGNNATHEFDIARWALQVKFPEEVSVTSGKNHYKDDPWTMYDTMYATIKFPGDKVINWDGKSRNSYQTYGAGRGTVIYGTEGSVFVDRSHYKHFDRDGKLITEKVSGGNEAGTALG